MASIIPPGPRSDRLDVLKLPAQRAEADVHHKVVACRKVLLVAIRRTLASPWAVPTRERAQPPARSCAVETGDSVVYVVLSRQVGDLHAELLKRGTDPSLSPFCGGPLSSFLCNFC
jgi:hypothetical protein